MRTVCSFVTVLIALCGAAHAAPPAAPADFEKDVRPLLETYCFNCHGNKRDRADVNLQKFTDVPSVQRDPKLWRNVLTQLNERSMPPDDKPQPTGAQRAMLIEWVQHTLTHFDASAFTKDPGRVTLRRLNRFEYNNTVRDLFDVASKPADAF